MIKILIIKLGALGDVLRTTPILHAIKEKYPDSEISWITKEESKDILENNPKINKVFTLPYKNNETFDILFNYDIDDEAIKLASNIRAKKRYGFYNNEGYPAASNMGAEDYLNTLFDDESKRNNEKTYQESIYHISGMILLPGVRPAIPRPDLILKKEDESYSNKFCVENNLYNKNLIGIHIGASSRWPSKAWSKDKVKEFIIKLKDRDYNIIVFAGSNEKEYQENLVKELNEQGIKVYHNNPSNSIKEFASLVKLCKIMVCSDSFALHISLALNIKTIGLFFCTSPDEIEGYGILTKIKSPLLHKFFPERMNEYSEELVNSISVEDVLKEVK